MFSIISEVIQNVGGFSSSGQWVVSPLLVRGWVFRFNCSVSVGGFCHGSTVCRFVLCPLKRMRTWLMQTNWWRINRTSMILCLVGRLLTYRLLASLL